MNTYFKNVPEENVLFFDIETIREYDVLPPKQLEVYKYKIRNKDTDEIPSDEEAQEDYKKRGGLKIGWNKIVAIGVGYIHKGEVRIQSLKGDSEEQILKDFFKITHSSKFDYICGFNILPFDLPMCNFRALVNKIDVSELMNPNFNVSGKKPWELKAVIDLMDVLRGTHYANVSLEETCMFLNIPTSKNDIKGSQVSEAWYNNEADRIYNYVKQDVLATINVFRRARFQDIFLEFRDIDEEVKLRIKEERERCIIDVLQNIAKQNFFSKEAQNTLIEHFKNRPKKLTNKELQVLEESLLASYIQNDFGNSDNQDVVLGKTAEIKNFIKQLENVKKK